MSDLKFKQEQTQASLITQIRNVEQRVLEHHRVVGISSATLLKEIQQQLTSPSSLLLAGGIGFLLSELTKSRSSKSHSTDEDKSHAAKTTPIDRLYQTALSLIGPANALYTAFAANKNPEQVDRSAEHDS
ncbi:hypothetical protein [Nitrosomonas sp. ANs5]|uniref:hypothetical protein n=1 Tax=Nitrosomonas sp. ANs5 TaxID=3423941 RepID=UPI003D340DFA